MLEKLHQRQQDPSAMKKKASEYSSNCARLESEAE